MLGCGQSGVSQGMLRQGIVCMLSEFDKHSVADWVLSWCLVELCFNVVSVGRVNGC